MISKKRIYNPDRTLMRERTKPNEVRRSVPDLSITNCRKARYHKKGSCRVGKTDSTNCFFMIFEQIIERGFSLGKTERSWKEHIFSFEFKSLTYV